MHRKKVHAKYYKFPPFYCLNPDTHTTGTLLDFLIFREKKKWHNRFQKKKIVECIEYQISTENLFPFSFFFGSILHDSRILSGERI